MHRGRFSVVAGLNFGLERDTVRRALLRFMRPSLITLFPGFRVLPLLPLLSGLIALLAVPAGTFAADDGKNKIPDHRYAMLPGFSRMPYLQMSGPESMVIVWRTKQAMTPVIRFGTDLQNLDRRSA